MHCTQHAGDEFVDSITLLNQRHQRRYSAFIIAAAPEMREDQLLELLYPILKHHQIRNGLVAFIWIIDSLQADVFLVFKCAIEIRMLLVERQLRQQEIDVFLNQWSISSHTLSSQASVKTVDPASIGHCISQGRRVPLLEDFMHRYQRLKCLHFICQDWLPAKHLGQLLVP
jgi:hypothetical protein